MKIKCKSGDFVVNEFININNLNTDYKFVDKENKFTVLFNQKESDNYQEHEDFYIICKIWKKYIEHFELIDFISKKLNIDKKNIYFCGIKDKYSNSTQYFSIWTNNENINYNKKLYNFIKNKTIETSNIKLEFLFFSKENISSENITKNNFKVVIRDIDIEDKDKLNEKINEIINIGVPNYFDEQRFGSFKKINGIPGKYIFQRNYEKFFISFVEPYENDKKEIKELKFFILNNWRKWDIILNKIYDYEKKIIKNKDINELKLLKKLFLFVSNYNSSPSFSKCIKKIDKNLIMLLINSYQSILFNSLLNYFFEYLHKIFKINLIIYKDKLNKINKLKYLEKIKGNFFYFYSFSQNNYEIFKLLKDFQLPLIGYDYQNELENYKEKIFSLINTQHDKIIGATLDYTSLNYNKTKNYYIEFFKFTEEKIIDLLNKEKLTIDKMKIKSRLNIDVGTKLRNIIVIPEEFNYYFEKDEIYKGKLKLVLNFNLPKGSFATIIVKRLTIWFAFKKTKN